MRWPDLGEIELRCVVVKSAEDSSQNTIKEFTNEVQLNDQGKSLQNFESKNYELTNLLFSFSILIYTFEILILNPAVSNQVLSYS